MKIVIDFHPDKIKRPVGNGKYFYEEKKSFDIYSSSKCNRGFVYTKAKKYIKTESKIVL